MKPIDCTDVDPFRREFLRTAAVLGGAGLVMNALPFAAGRANAAPAPEGKYFSHNVTMLGYHDLGGRPGFQMAMQIVKDRYYLYTGSFAHAGWTILDVTDPSNPTDHVWLPYPGDKPGTVFPKVQVADGLMITMMERSYPLYHGTKEGAPFDAGVLIWDVKEPLKPKLLSKWETGAGQGTHRSFYGGGRYVHLSSTAPGYDGHIYRILDISDPRKPVEAGRWWLPDQWVAGGASSERGVSLHGAPYLKGNLAYLPYGAAGLLIVDISDVKLPRFVGRLDTHPPFGDGAPPLHSAVPLSKSPHVVISSEGRRPSARSRDLIGKHEPAVNFIGMVDVRNPADPSLIAVFPTPVPPADAPYRNFSQVEGLGAFGFGPHNLHQPHGLAALEDRNDRVYCAYFNAGLRIYDTSDPYLPKEIAYFIPPVPTKFAFNEQGLPGPKSVTVEDVLVDNRGVIYITNMHQGLWTLRCAA